MPDDPTSPLSAGTAGWTRTVGWGVFAGAPIMLIALATVVSRPAAPANLLSHSLGAATIAGGLGFGAAVLHARGAERVARRIGTLAAVVVASFSAFLVWLASTLPP